MANNLQCTDNINDIYDDGDDVDDDNLYEVHSNNVSISRIADEIVSFICKIHIITATLDWLEFFHIAP